MVELYHAIAVLNVQHGKMIRWIAMGEEHSALYRTV